MTIPPSIDNRTLRELIVQHFSVAELDLFVNDYFPGFNTIVARPIPLATLAQELIAYCERTGQRDKLINTIHRERPILFPPALDILSNTPQIPNDNTQIKPENENTLTRTSTPIAVDVQKSEDDTKTGTNKNNKKH
jgi:hypothetical protein